MLKDEPGREVLRIGDHVHRPAGSWTPAVRALLRHLEAVGSRYAPRAVGTDDHGRAGVGTLVRRMARWRVGLRWYAVALLLPVAIAGGAHA